MKTVSVVKWLSVRNSARQRSRKIRVHRANEKLLRLVARTGFCAVCLCAVIAGGHTSAATTTLNLGSVGVPLGIVCAGATNDPLIGFPAPDARCGVEGGFDLAPGDRILGVTITGRWLQPNISPTSRLGVTSPSGNDMLYGKLGGFPSDNFIDAGTNADFQATEAFTASESGTYTFRVEFGSTVTVDNIRATILFEQISNTPPTANAGADQTVTIGDTVTLDGSGSSDFDEDPLTYQWTLESPPGVEAILSDATSVAPTFFPDVAGTYEATLIVNDGADDSDPDTVIINVNVPGSVNTPPTANAGADQTVTSGDTVTLDGSGSSDANEDPLTYQWTLVSPMGSEATLSDATSVAPTFFPDVAGTYQATLIVNDGTDDSDPDTVIINVNVPGSVNTPPTANAGADQTVTSGDTVTLDGSGSSDANEDPLTYQWTLVSPMGSEATLSDATSVAPTFFPDVAGTYQATLIVNDGIDDSDPDTVTINADVIVQFDPSTLSPITKQEDSAAFEVAVLVSSPSTQEISVVVGSQDATATSNEDYAAVNKTLVWAPGESGARTVTVTINDDLLFEGAEPESFTLNLSELMGNATLGENDTLSVEITDNDVAPSVSLETAATRVVEDDTTITLNVDRSGATGGELRVDFSTADGTAVAPEDYGAASGTLVWPDGDASPKTIEIEIVGNQDLESPTETFLLTLSNPQGFNFAPEAITQTEVTIRDDDSPPGGEDAPIANVGEDQVIESPDGADVEVALDGSNSVDPDGDPIVAYRWTLDGTEVSTEPAFTITLGPGEYVFALEVTDDTGQQGSSQASVVITRAAIQDEESLEELPDLDENQKSTAAAVDSVCNALNTSSDPLTDDQEDLRVICSDLIISGTDAEQIAALDELSGEQITGQQTNAVEISGVQLRNIAGRVRALREGARGVSVAGLGFSVDGKHIPSTVLEAMLDGITGGSAGEGAGIGSRLGVFISGNISYGDKDETDNETGFEFNTAGISAGFDYRFTDSLFAGLAFGYGSGDTDFDDEAGGLKSDGYSLSLFGSFYRERFYVDTIATYGWSDHESKRKIRFQDVDRTAEGDTNGDQLSFGLESGLTFEKSGFSFSPNVSIFFTDVDIDAFRETGAGGLDLAFDQQSVQSLTIAAGVQAGYSWKVDWGVIRPQVRVDYVTELEDEAQTINVRFANDPFANDPVSPTAPIAVTTDEPDTGYFLIGVGVSAQFRYGLSGFVDWQTLQGYEDLEVNSFSFGLRWERVF